MIVTRIQLYCANHETCGQFFPADGPMDGAIFTGRDLRQEARQRAGWSSRVTPQGARVDLCPRCRAEQQEAN